MTIPRWLLAISVAAIAMVAGAPAPGATIRDPAGMFSPQAVENAQSRLDRLERGTRIPVVIETIDALPGVETGASREERVRAINEVAKRRDREIRDEGIYILISKRDTVVSNPLIRARLEPVLPSERRRAIRDAFIPDFKKHDFDGGLNRAVQTIEESLKGVAAPNRRAQGPGGVPAPLGRAGHAGGGTSMLGTFLLIGLGIIAVLVILRILGGLFGRSAGAGYPNQMGGMGMGRPGMGPGPGGGPGYYGGPGSGGRGGGFFSGLLGGLGGAMAGNWLYDQMSGRHGHMTSGTAYPPEDPSAGIPDPGGDAIMGAEDEGGRGASWDDAGGGDTGGGDWGGGDTGGGDWGGGDAGGDWGGGGDVGGDW